MFYGAAIWDPWLIISQIVVLQCSFYLLVGAWLILFSYVFGSAIDLAHLLNPKALCVEYAEGWPSVFAYLLVCPPG